MYVFSDPSACDWYWTNGYRKEDFAEEFYWEHSDERIKFLKWWTPPQDSVHKNWVLLRRDANDDDRSWMLYSEFNHTYAHCSLCEIDLPLN